MCLCLVGVGQKWKKQGEKVWGGASGFLQAQEQLGGSVMSSSLLLESTDPARLKEQCQT